MRFLIFENVLRMNVERYSMKTFGKILSAKARRTSLNVFLPVMVLSSRILLMEGGLVDIG